MKFKTHNNPEPKKPTAQETKAASDSQTELHELRRVIRQGYIRWKRLVILETLGLAIAAPLLYLWMIVGLDSLFHLSMPGRFLASLVFLAAVVWQSRRLRSSWRQAHFTDEQVALAMERNTPGGLENRLINSVQLAAAAAPDAIRSAVVRENYQRLRKLHIEQAAHSRPAAIRIGLAAAAIIAGLAFHGVQPERFFISTTRILLPFLKLAPLYRTRLIVEPGNTHVNVGSDVRVTVQIDGYIPDQLLVISQSEGKRVTENVSIPAGTHQVEYIFRNLREPLTYAIRAGDYTTPLYTIDVPVSSELQRLRVKYDYPDYTGLPDRIQEGAGGDMQAVFGTEAKLRIFLTRPAQSASILFSPAIETPDAIPPAAGEQRIELKREGPSEFSGPLTFNTACRYRIETSQELQPPVTGRTYNIEVLADQPPALQLIGLTDGSDIMLDAVMPVTLVGRDDFGLLSAGVFSRLKGNAETPWETLESWAFKSPTRTFDRDWVLPIAGIGAAEGDTVEVAIRGQDNNPLRDGIWYTGQHYTLTLGGEDAKLQFEYEKILQAETNLTLLIQGALETSEALGKWLLQLNADNGGRLDDQTFLQTLTRGMNGLAETQSGLRTLAATTAREMPEPAGSLKLSLGMLADSEMIRAIQMTESVTTRENPLQMRAVLGEVRLTQERIMRSLREVQTAYIQFRRDWELENMLPFTHMLSQRQKRMGEESLTYASLPAAAAGARLREGTSRRQNRLKELTALTQTAFTGIALRVDILGERMAAGFTEAALQMGGEKLNSEMEQAAARLLAGKWEQAAPHQEQAAAELNAIYERLRQTQADVARQMMEALKAMAEDSPEAQAAIKALDPGSGEQKMHGDLNVMTEIVKMTALAEAIKNKRFETQPDGDPQAEGKLSDYISTHVGSGNKMSEEKRDFSIMKLASSPSGQLEMIPGFKTDDKMEISVIKEYQDVVGDLLEEADDIREEYQSVVNMLQGQDVEGGDIGKGGHGMASVSAAAPTGNMKPDTHEHGGASRVGRQGARATGAAVGKESISRRGRDEAQEGSQEVPDVAGAIKETLSDDPSTDHSTGIGGREVDSQAQTSFSTKDAGEWKDDMATRMKAPQSTYQIVERAGAPLAPEVADKLRAMDSAQNQLIERVKRVKKELDKLYLPTESLDDALRKFSANLDRLRERPDAEAFRLQTETLEHLIGAVMVFDRPSPGFEPSLVRKSALRGEILDEPPGPAQPGYEEAVKRYYERLAEP